MLGYAQGRHDGLNGCCSSWSQIFFRFPPREVESRVEGGEAKSMSNPLKIISPLSAPAGYRA